MTSRIICLFLFYCSKKPSSLKLSSISVPRFACLMALIRYLVNFTFNFFFHGAFREIFSLSIIFLIADLEIGNLISNTVVWTKTYIPAHLLPIFCRDKMFASSSQSHNFFCPRILYIIIPFPLCSSGVLLACENRTVFPRSSQLGMFREEECLRLSDINSILMT